VKFLVVINTGPWASSLATTALRFVRAAVDSGMDVRTVYFREDGVYHAIAGRACDAGTPRLHEAWKEISAAGVELLLCRSSSERRLERSPEDGFREAGLVQLMERLSQADRVVSF
jgi:sulfur relay protein TusD/DsrE